MGAAGQTLRRAIAIAWLPKLPKPDHIILHSPADDGHAHMGDIRWTSISPDGRRSSPEARRASDWPSLMLWPPKGATFTWPPAPPPSLQGRRGHPRASQGQGVVPS